MKAMQISQRKIGHFPKLSDQTHLKHNNQLSPAIAIIVGLNIFFVSRQIITFVF